MLEMQSEPMTETNSATTPEAPPPYASPRILDSRRVFGPNLFSEYAGAVLEVSCPDDRSFEALRLWPDEVLQLAGTLGWEQTQYACRQSSGAASLFLEAPIDGLMTATEVAELAWVAVERRLGASDLQPSEGEADDQRLRMSYENERASMPRFAELARTARATGRNVTVSDEALLIGSGVGSKVYPRDAPAVVGERNTVAGDAMREGRPDSSRAASLDASLDASLKASPTLRATSRRTVLLCLSPVRTAKPQRRGCLPRCAARTGGSPDGVAATAFG